jgi:hypothetical protein
MVEAGYHGCFRHEAAHQVVVPEARHAGAGTHGLYGHPTLELDVPSPEDGAHRAAPQDSTELETPELDDSHATPKPRLDGGELSRIEGRSGRTGRRAQLAHALYLARELED